MVSAMNRRSSTKDSSSNTGTQETTAERKKNNKKLDSAALYNSEGKLISSGEDLCDCLNIKCPGCYFICRRCRSNKCGAECRCGRTYMYESAMIDGTNQIVHNPCLKK